MYVDQDLSNRVDAMECRVESLVDEVNLFNSYIDRLEDRTNYIVKLIETLDNKTSSNTSTVQATVSKIMELLGIIITVILTNRFIT